MPEANPCIGGAVPGSLVGPGLDLRRAGWDNGWPSSLSHVSDQPAARHGRERSKCPQFEKPVVGHPLRGT